MNTNTSRKEEVKQSKRELGKVYKKYKKLGRNMVSCIYVSWCELLRDKDENDISISDLKKCLKETNTGKSWYDQYVEAENKLNEKLKSNNILQQREIKGINDLVDRYSKFLSEYKKLLNDSEKENMYKFKFPGDVAELIDKCFQPKSSGRWKSFERWIGLSQKNNEYKMIKSAWEQIREKLEANLKKKYS